VNSWSSGTCNPRQDLIDLKVKTINATGLLVDPDKEDISNYTLHTDGSVLYKGELYYPPYEPDRFQPISKELLARVKSFYTDSSPDFYEKMAYEITYSGCRYAGKSTAAAAQRYVVKNIHRSPLKARSLGMSTILIANFPCMFEWPDFEYILGIARTMNKKHGTINLWT
jgi:hypothetical protein